MQAGLNTKDEVIRVALIRHKRETPQTLKTPDVYEPPEVDVLHPLAVALAASAGVKCQHLVLLPKGLCSHMLDAWNKISMGS